MVTKWFSGMGAGMGIGSVNSLVIVLLDLFFLYLIL